MDFLGQALYFLLSLQGWAHIMCSNEVKRDLKYILQTYLGSSTDSRYFALVQDGPPNWEHCKKSKTSFSKQKQNLEKLTLCILNVPVSKVSVKCKNRQVFQRGLYSSSPCGVCLCTSDQYLAEDGRWDEILQALKAMLQAGRSEIKDRDPDSTREYLVYWEEIRKQNRVSYKGPRIVLAKVMRMGVLSRIHASHQGT